MSNEDQFQSEPDGPSYVWEMFKRPFNLNIGLTTVAAAAFLAIPFGAAGVALPLLVLGAGEAIAAMFIPASASFRVKIDREYAARARAETSAHLCAEIRRRVGADDARWGIYERLCERIDSLREMARHRRSGLNDRDLRKLEESCVDYLGLWLAEQSMIERQGAIDERGIERRIADIRQRLAAGADDSASLRKASADLEELLLRHRRLASRRAAVEAALLALPDAFEEIYYAVVTMPAGDQGTQLQDAIDRLRLEQELESSYGAEIRDLVPAAAVRAASANVLPVNAANTPPPSPLARPSAVAKPMTRK